MAGDSTTLGTGGPIGSANNPNQSEARPPPPTLTRRQLVTGAGGSLVALGLAGFVGYKWPRQAAGAVRSSGSNASALSALQSFVTEPDLLPPRVRVTTYSSSAVLTPPFIFLAPRNYNASAPGQGGLMIVDRSGRLVWFKPITDQSPFDFDAQPYAGRSVLTWWQGELVVDYGVGTGEIASSSYALQGKVHAGGGLRADLHELKLTNAGTALVTAYDVVNADLSSRGGQAKGQLVTGHAQEIDLATGKLLFDWDSSDHIGLDESYQGVPPAGPYDYFHINSIAETPDGNLLISARNTWTLYKVDRSTGKVIWRLNGKKSDFTMGPGAAFSWQHDARPHGPTSLSVFDDSSASGEEGRSRGLLLNVDNTSMHVSVAHAYLHPAGFHVANQGNVQVLADGRVFVGWGDQPYFSEFARDGTLLLDGEMPIGYRSYRALCHDWVGRPTEPPAVAARPNPAGGTVVYASWNGATNLHTWTVLAGDENTSLEVIGSQPSTGFETAIAVGSTAPYYATVAMGPDGKELGRSAVVTVTA
jgi:outer membrane protein assembly factor BamB